jgi:hypothetical protein
VAKRKARSKKRSWLLRATLGLAVLGTIALALLAAWVLEDLPRFDHLTEYEP